MGLDIHEKYEEISIRQQGQCAADISNALEQFTLRDVIAMHALTGIIANPNDFYGDREQLASTAYEFADAMLKIRKRK